MIKKKEIYQGFPQGGVHLKHAAIPRDITRTVSGTPPLTIRTSKPRTIKEITIYGNTVDGHGVGDRTANLWNPTTFDFTSAKGLKHELLPDGGIRIYGTKTADTTWIVIRCSTDLDPSRYTSRISFSANPGNQSNKIMTNWGGYFDSDQRTGIYFSPSNGFTCSESEIISEVRYYFPSSIATGTYVDVTAYFMLNEGAAAIPYEPYGYKVPFSDNGDALYTLYMDEPLYSDDAYEASLCGSSVSLPYGTNLITSDTSVKPLEISISYS